MHYAWVLYAVYLPPLHLGNCWVPIYLTIASSQGPFRKIGEDVVALKLNRLQNSLQMEKRIKVLLIDNQYQGKAGKQK